MYLYYSKERGDGNEGLVGIFFDKILIALFAALLLACGGRERNDGVENQRSGSWTGEERSFLVNGLKKVQTDLQKEVAELNEAQWFFKPDTNAWSISEVVEHLEVHDELFRREITVITQFPEMTHLSHLATDKDEDLLAYSQITDQNIAKAPWYLKPLGRWSSGEDALSAFNRVRDQLIRFIRETDKDLRKYYSPSGKGEAAYRDLHQLMLVSIAHANRHLEQIRRIKNHPDFKALR